MWHISFSYLYRKTHQSLLKSIPRREVQVESGEPAPLHTMTADDKSDGSVSSEGSASSQGTIEKICAKENNVRARVGLYMKDGERLRADFHALYRALPDLRYDLRCCLISFRV